MYLLSFLLCISSTGANLVFPLSDDNIRSIDGSETVEGQAGAAQIRISGAHYPGNGSGNEIDLTNVPNSRSLSNACFAQDKLESSEKGLSNMVWQFGQFLDHDIVLTPQARNAGSANVPMPPGDMMGSRPMPFMRSAFHPSTGTSRTNPRQQVNLITSVIDGSAVYGSDHERARALREFQGGRLKIMETNLIRRNNFYDLPPRNTELLENELGPRTTDPAEFLLMGDVRGNEQSGLLAIHTLFLREHNRLADKLARDFPNESDERIYQLARKIVGAEIQKITYDEFLPALLGPYAPSTYRGYNATLSAGMANEFAAGAFRVGHSMLSPDLVVKGRLGNIQETLPLRDAFFNPEYLKRDPGKVDGILHGLATEMAQQIDTHIISDVRDFLFGPPGSGGMDLAALNIQRGRDHGLPTYNDAREAYGLPRKTGFMQVTKNVKLRAGLIDQYQGDVDKVELWVGGLAEDHVDGGAVGELFATIMAEQFDRLMHADPFFYLNDKDMQSSAMSIGIRMNNVKLSTIMASNTRLGSAVSGNVFYAKASPKIEAFSLRDDSVPTTTTTARPRKRQRQRGRFRPALRKRRRRSINLFSGNNNNP